ncbi:acyltransferase family protein [Flavobacterium hauense]
MDTNNNYKLYGLDHLRFIAIAYVFFFHYFILSNGEPNWLPGFAKFGWTGVDLFFVLSGFLISSQLFAQIKQRQNISFRQFFLKRFFRIIPAFWVTVLLYFSFPVFREKEALPPFRKFLTFTQNIGLDLKNFGTFSHAWSLCVEEHFYLFLPVILIVLQIFKANRMGYVIIIALFLMGFIARIYSYNYLYIPKVEMENSWMYWYKYIYYPTWNRMDGLLTGVVIAGIYQFSPIAWERISKYGNLLLVSGLLVLTGASFLCEDQQSFNASVFGFTIVAFGYGLIVTGAICPTSFLYKWNSKFTSFMAKLSYGIYLTHKGIIHITHSILDDLTINSNITMLICILNCVVFAYLLNIAVEKPFMRLRHKFIT